MRYELWHIGSANLMDDFQTESEALDAVRVYLTPDERGSTVDVALVIYDVAGRGPRSLQGPELASLAFSQSTGHARQSA